jgi:hypothetical protein
MDSGDVEECASREQHGYTSEGKLYHVHDLCNRINCQNTESQRVHTEYVGDHAMPSMLW